MNYYLFIDDERNPKDVTWVNLPKGVDWVVVRSFNEFVNTVLQKGLPVFVSFDHDLADAHYANMPSAEKTGYDCAKWLVDYCLDSNLNIPEFAVHSMNPVGAENIRRYLQNAKKFLSKDK